MYDCLNQMMRIERGVRGKMVITKCNEFSFIYMARQRTKFGSRRKLRIKCFPSKTLGPVEKSLACGHVVSLFETSGCLFAGKAIRRAYRISV